MSKVFIIAEAGVNHNGKIELAKKLIDVAADAKADAIKFQTYHTSQLACKTSPKAVYQLKASKKLESQYEMLKKLELTDEMHQELITYCEQKNLLFLSSPFDMQSIEQLHSYGIEIFKIPSGEITNYPYLKKIASYGKKIIVSTGMSNLEEINAAIKVLQDNGAKELIIMHCNTEYPTPIEDVNLNAMKTIRKATGLPVGYSDHTVGIEIPVAAVALGAIILEKHITLDKFLEGPDHKASLTPDEFKKMVDAIRKVEKALGRWEKEPTQSEQKNIAVVRKSIVAKRDILKGEALSEENITAKRPGTGLSPMLWNQVIGTCAFRDFKEDEVIEIN